MVNNYHNMQRGFDFAATFQRACLEAIRPHRNLGLFQVRRENDNAAFMLANGDERMFIVTKWRSGTGHEDLFGVNANDWHWWQNPWPVPVVDLQAPPAQRELQEVGAHQVTILAYASYRPENERLFAQWIPNIEVMPGGPVVLPNGEQVFDTVLASYANLSIILQQGIGMDEQLAQQVERQTLANALATPILNPNAG